MRTEKIDAWVVTLWPEDHAARAIGPDEPDIEAAVLLFLGEAEAEEYRRSAGWSDAVVVRVEVRPVPVPPRLGRASGWKPVFPPTIELEQVAARDT